MDEKWSLTDLPCFQRQIKDPDIKMARGDFDQIFGRISFIATLSEAKQCSPTTKDTLLEISDSSVSDYYDTSVIPSSIVITLAQQ